MRYLSRIPEVLEMTKECYVLKKVTLNVTLVYIRNITIMIFLL